MAADQSRIEVERIINLVQGFGWSLSKQEITDTEIHIVLVKKRPVTSTPSTPS